MASTYSTNLKLELIDTGDQSGTWGNTTNTNLGTLLEQAIVGYVTQAVTDGAATVLTIPDGASSNGRNYVIELTGALTANRTVEVPAVDKPYIFFNNTTGGFSVTVKVSGQTGVTIANGKKAIVYTNSTDVIEVVNAPVSEAGTQTLTNKTLSAPTVTGQATFAAGTAAAPAITTTGDTNTGIFFPAADTIAFSDGGSERMRIDSSGNVGIGTSSPSTKLSISTAATTDAVRWTDGVNSTGLLSTTTGASTLWATAALAFGTGAASFTERMRIDSSGNVGIGTTTTSGFRVAVVGSAASSVPLYLNTDATNSYVYSTSPVYLGSTGAYQVSFVTNNSERMRIDSSGYVGIGTTSPSAMLHVTGSSAIAALKVPNILEVSTVSATAATGTINYDAATQSVLYYTSNASANWTLNIRASSGTSLNTFMATGDTLTIVHLVTQGSTAYYNSAVQVDGSSVTPKWQGGTAPTSGNASAIDVYTYTVIKTGSAAFTVLASQTQFK